MKEWFKGYREAAPFLVVLFILGIALILKLPNFSDWADYALVALTGVYAFATIMVVKANRRTIDEMRQSRLDAVKPALSLQPGQFTEGGNLDFSALYLHNSGGVAKEIKIDINITNPASKKSLFMTALSKEHVAYLPIENISELYKSGGLAEISVTYKDSYDQNLNTNLSFDFSNLQKEGREVLGQYSELHEISEALEDIKRKRF